MNICMFSSWQVRCGIADPHAREMISHLNTLPDTRATIVPFDRKTHPRQDYVSWGRTLDSGDVAHIQFDYSFFDYLYPWRQKFAALRGEISKPLVITRHVSFDGKLALHGRGIKGLIHRAKWRIYQHPLNPYATYLNKTIFAQTAHVIVLTQRLREQLLHRGIPPDKVSIIPAGVRAFQVAGEPERAKLRATLGWADKTIVGQFGFIAPPKAHALMLEALLKLPNEFVYLIGGGVRLETQQPMLDALVAKIKMLGLEARVKITGFLEDTQMPAHVAACDVQVFPYTHADFSQSVADALAHAHCPVIASDIDGHREIKGYCAALTLFPSGDSEALAQKIQTMAEASADVRSQMRVEMSTYREAYSWRAIAQRTRDVYRRAVDQAQA